MSRDNKVRVVKDLYRKVKVYIFGKPPPELSKTFNMESIGVTSKIYQVQCVNLSQRNSVHLQLKCNFSFIIIKTNYGSETVIPIYITGYREKIYSESAVIAKRRRLIRAIYFLTTAGDIKRYHRLRTVVRLVSGFFLTLCAC